MGRRRPSPQSGPEKAFNAVRAIVRSASKPTGRTSSKAGKAAPLGLAVLAGAAGLAFSQRDKLKARLGGSREQRRDEVIAPPPVDDQLETQPVVPPAPPSSGP